MEIPQVVSFWKECKEGLSAVELKFSVNLRSLQLEFVI